MDNLMKMAVEYATRYDWHVFPTREVDGEPYLKNGKLVKSTAKSPYIAGGLNSASKDPQQIRDWFCRFPNAGIGLNCGLSKIFVIDIDNHVEGRKSGRDHFMSLNIPYRDTWQSLTPTGGRHLIYSDPKGLGRNKTDNVIQVDQRGVGGYIILPASWLLVDGDKRAYTRIGQWLGRPMEILPHYLNILNPDDKIKTTRKRYEPIKNTNQKEIMRISSALQGLDSKYCDNRDSWIRVGIALKELGEVGFELWDAWSAKSSKYDNSVMEKQWDSLSNDGRVGMGTLFRYAKQSGWRWNG